MTVLLLAGTGEARALSKALEAAGVDLVASLAGATQRPMSLGGRVRIGGFGGVEGLRRFLAAGRIRAIVDATHPFAARMSRNAVEAAGAVPLIRLVRPPWPEDPAWIAAEDLEAAARLLPAGSVAFLSTGRGSLRHFAGRPDVRFVARVIDDLPGDFPLARGHFLVSRPPFSVEEEMRTLQAEGITHLVSRNSGGTGGIEKVIAAKRLGIPVVMVARPALAPAREVATMEEVLGWLAGVLADPPPEETAP